MPSSVGTVDRAAEHQLRVGHRHREREVVRVVLRPPEHPVRRDVHLDVQVARGGAAAARLALAGELDPLPVVHPRGNADGERAGAGADAVAAALGARVVDDPAGAAAVRARLGERERALVAADQAAPAARRALPRGGARPGAGAARTSGSGPGAESRIGTSAPRTACDEVDPQLALDVRAALAARRRRPRCRGRRAAAEDPAEQVAQARAGAAGVAEQVAHVERLPAAGEAACAEAAREARRGTPPPPPPANRARVSSYSLALLLVREHPVGLGHRLEAGLGLGVAGVGVRVQLAGELAVRLLDLVLGRAGGDAQLTVEVLLDPVALGHRRLLSCVSPSGRRGRSTGIPSAGSRWPCRRPARSTTATIAGRSTRSPMR